MARRTPSAPPPSRQRRSTARTAARSPTWSNPVRAIIQRSAAALRAAVQEQLREERRRQHDLLREFRANAAACLDRGVPIRKVTELANDWVQHEDMALDTKGIRR